MTIGAIVGCSVVSAIIIIGGICLIASIDEVKATVIICLAGLLIIGAIWGGTAYYFNATESGKRALKTQESNFGGGITREVKVFDATGDVIATYKGKFDIEYDNDRILFDDESGLRHIIYYPTGTVIVDEIEE